MITFKVTTESPLVVGVPNVLHIDAAQDPYPPVVAYQLAFRWHQERLSIPGWVNRGRMHESLTDLEYGATEYSNNGVALAMMNHFWPGPPRLLSLTVMPLMVGDCPFEIYGEDPVTPHTIIMEQASRNVLRVEFLPGVTQLNISPAEAMANPDTGLILGQLITQNYTLNAETRLDLLVAAQDSLP